MDLLQEVLHILVLDVQVGVQAENAPASVLFANSVYVAKSVHLDAAEALLGSKMVEAFFFME